MAKTEYWNGYLDTTLFAPWRAILTFVPAAVFFVLGLTVWNVGSIPATFVAWGWFGVADIVCCWRDPADFGLKLFFPTLKEDPGSLALVRTFLLIDLAVSAPRAAFGIWPESPVLFTLAAITAVAQFFWSVREYKYGIVDIRGVNIAASGPAILAVLLVAHAAMGGVVWAHLP